MRSESSLSKNPSSDNNFALEIEIADNRNPKHCRSHSSGGVSKEKLCINLTSDPFHLPSKGSSSNWVALCITFTVDRSDCVCKPSEDLALSHTM
ncbi:hypothetical protein CDAR_192261 [Caerostris darwini]|uniref:Uncharacterized protein n=1 Tax=Caerostris darwini TaxID=1538125 RepID=A0AAV4TUA0_9ARAC|nr:hypothetical protein CDAR_192261 [Caerostris darwini]